VLWPLRGGVRKRVKVRSGCSDRCAHNCLIGVRHE
jgi:hypothetical protein